MTRRFPSLIAYLRGTGQTQDQLAEALGIPQGQLSNYISGRHMPRPKMALKISAHTGVSVESLMRTRAGRAA